MAKKRELELLKKYPESYLWDKPINKWTKQDVENLKKGIIKLKPTKSGVKRPVIVAENQVDYEYKSVAEAARIHRIPVQKIYNILYLKCAQLDTVKFAFKD